MNYFSPNKKLLITIVAITASLALSILWFQHVHMYGDTMAPDFYAFSAFLSAFAALDVALVVTALWRTFTYLRGNRQPEKYPVTVIALTLLIAGILLSIAAYTSPITAEISVTACNTGSMISTGTPECYGSVTNPGLWPSIGIAIAGFLFTSLSIFSRILKRSAKSK